MSAETAFEKFAAMMKSRHGTTYTEVEKAMWMSGYSTGVIGTRQSIKEEIL